MNNNLENGIAMTVKVALIWFVFILNGCQLAPHNTKKTLAYDAQLVSVANEVAGFGGMFHDVTGLFTVYLAGASWNQSLTQPAVVENQLRTAFVDIFDMDMSAGETIVYLEGQYDTIQLDGWNTKAASLQIDGLLSTDLDARRNRVAIAIADESARASVETAVVAQQIPIDAVIIEVIPTSTAPANLDEQFALIAAEVAGFGGLFRDAGAFKVYLMGENWKLSRSQPTLVEDRLRTAIIKILGTDVSNGQTMTFLQGQYDAIQLSEWKQRASYLFLIGATGFDFDEARNRVWVGIADESMREKAKAGLIMQEVPLEAVIIEVFGGVSLF